MKFRLRTLFLITTIVAIIAFTFTLGSAEGVFTIVFFGAIFATSPKKDRWKSGLIVVLIWFGPGIYTWQSKKSELGRPSNGKTACVDMVFTGSSSWEREEEVMRFLLSDMPSSWGVRKNSGSVMIPFYNPSYVKLSFDEKHLPEIEAEIRQKLAKEFPDLQVSIKSYSRLSP